MCMLKMWEREALGSRRKRTLLGFEEEGFCGREDRRNQSLVLRPSSASVLTSAKIKDHCRHSQYFNLLNCMCRTVLQVLFYFSPTIRPQYFTSC